MKSKSSKSEAVDRRVRRTKRQLHEALIGLILERGWDQVSVQDVCARADVGRSTFYLHFADKEELLVSGLEDLHGYLEELRSHSSGSFSFAEALLEHARERLRLFRALMGKKSGASVLRGFRDVVVRLVEADLASAKVPAELRGVAARYIAGGFVDLMTEWLERPSQTSAANLASTFRRFSSGVLRSAGARYA